MSFTTDIPSFWSNGEGAYLNINGGRLETGNNLVFRTASPDGWNGDAGQTMNLNGGSVIVGGDFNFGQANCYDTILMNNDNDYLEINHNWNYITLTDMEGKWTAGNINFQGPTWQVNEASGPKSVYSSGTHSIRFYYADGKQTILWDNPNEFINAEDGSKNTLRTFNFDYIDPETGECLGLIFPDGYSDELYWFRPWFEVETPAEWIPYEEWKNYPDTDGDGLPDEIEKYIGTDPLKKDTDDDGLTDYDEVFKTMTDPTMYDTDSNGISDGMEDPDNDDLNNINEMSYKTDPYNEDSDMDGLTDGDEINIYHSNPLKYDTDGDTLNDGDDVALGFDPTLPDTDFNGILDCDEKAVQTLTLDVADDNNPIESVSVSFEGTGNINSNTSINDVMNKDMMCSNVAGLIGNPYDINSTSSFDEAEISFKIRTNKLGGTSFDNLAILWYDEENHKFVEVNSTLNSTENTVSAIVPHFSKYMIVDKIAWYAVWENDLYDAKYKLVNAILAIDCSGSMEDNDPIQIIPPSTPPYEVSYKSERSTAAKGFIDTLKESDKAAIVGFANTATWLCGNLTSNKATLKSSLDNLYQEGSTNFNPVLSESISKLSVVSDDSLKIIILMSDGGMLDDLDESLNESLLTEAKTAGIKIYTIGLGAEADESILMHIAEATNGEYYRATTAGELSELYAKLGVAKDFDLTDTDGDGLADVFEISGMRLENGEVIYTDPLNPDSDGDGMEDGEEINPEYKYLSGAPSDIQYSTKSIYFVRNFCDDDYFDVTKHNFSKCESDCLVCSDCGYKVKSPVMQDKDVLSEDDYLKVQVLYSEFSKIFAEQNEISLLEASQKYNNSMYIIEIEKIRSQEQYRDKYEYIDGSHNYYSDVLESVNLDDIYYTTDANGKLVTTNHCNCWVETVDESNKLHYDFEYVAVPFISTVVATGIGISHPYIGAILSAAISVSDGTMTVNETGTNVFYTVLGVLPKAKGYDIALAMTSLIQTSDSTFTNQNDLKPQYGDKFVYINKGWKCECGYRTCKFPAYTSVATYWYRDGEINYYSFAG